MNCHDVNSFSALVEQELCWQMLQAKANYSCAADNRVHTGTANSYEW